jgi:PEP-CTERM motif
MKIKPLVQAALITGVAIFMMAASASATNITYNTVTGTGFNGVPGTLTLNSTSGVAAQLTYATQSTTVNASPTAAITLGNFTLTCLSCTGSTFAFFPAFTFQLQDNETSPFSATGVFGGSAVASFIFSNSGSIAINWLPLTLGPGTANASGGTDFGTTSFSITSPTVIGPNTNGGVSSVLGTATSSAVNPVPEPATLGLVGCSLLGLGMLRRKRSAR